MATNDSDNEINSIMNEIEELQKEMAPQSPAPAAVVAAATVVAPAAAPVEPVTEVSAEAPAEIAEEALAGDDVEDILNEIQAKADHMSLEDTLSDIKAEDTDDGLLDVPDEEDEEIKSVSETLVAHEEESMPKDEQGQGTDGTLSLTLSGNMTVKLKYEFEGQEVTISFADQTLRVGMADGTEFKVPVGARTAASAGGSNVKPFKKAV
jgi:hypothetical protein